MSEPYLYPHEFEPVADLPPPSGTTLLRHFLFLAITFCTATIAGVIPPFGPGIAFPPLELPIWNDTALFVSWIPTIYALFLIDIVYQIVSNSAMLIYGMSFSVPLLIILICHEMGHYIACRIYKVDSTLPYFIPTPPMIGPAGTFGAFIRIRSRIPTRRAVFDIGVAGPIAGFLALIPVALIGVWIMRTLPPGTPIPPDTLVFADPLLMKGIGLALGKDMSLGTGNPFYFAAWMGMLVTALNLIPSGQLDGGHAIYAALGERIHSWTGKLAFAAMALISVLGMLIYSSPSGFLIAILLGVMMRIPHPEPWDNSPLDTKRRVVAVLTLIIFIICFVPFPLQIT
jgi:membrane-associated protease RseP (regulator of RpoE activity)